MGDQPSEHSSVDSHGIRPPDAYVIEVLEPSDGVAVLVLEGEFDLAAAPALREHLDAARQAAARGVALDFAEVTFVDSSGLRELLLASTALRAEGKVLVLVALQPAVVRLLELTGATEAVLSAPTLERALTLLAEQP
jgi:anti-sigma B factor antagonist